MPKSHLQLLKEALALGDIAKAGEIAAKMDKVKVKPKPKPKPKPKSKAKPPLEIANLQDTEYIAPSRDVSQYDGRSFVGADGKEHKFGRRVSMEGIKFVNGFDPSDYEPLSSKEVKVEKALSKLRTTPKPGQRGADREPIAKVQVRCIICHETVKVYPWEVETVDGESNFRCSKRSCVKAR